MKKLSNAHLEQVVGAAEMLELSIYGSVLGVALWGAAHIICYGVNQYPYYCAYRNGLSEGRAQAPVNIINVEQGFSDGWNEGQRQGLLEARRRELRNRSATSPAMPEPSAPPMPGYQSEIPMAYPI